MGGRTGGTDAAIRHELLLVYAVRTSSHLPDLAPQTDAW